MGKKIKDGWKKNHSREGGGNVYKVGRKRSEMLVGRKGNLMYFLSSRDKSISGG